MSKIFSDTEIKEILELVQHDKHTQYIGARYVPMFGRKGEERPSNGTTKPHTNH